METCELAGNQPRPFLVGDYRDNGKENGNYIGIIGVVLGLFYKKPSEQSDGNLGP